MARPGVAPIFGATGVAGLAVMDPARLNLAPQEPWTGSPDRHALTEIVSQRLALRDRQGCPVRLSRHIGSKSRSGTTAC